MADMYKALAGEEKGGISVHSPFGLDSSPTVLSSSIRSGETLHNDGLSLHSDVEGAFSFSSPLSANEIDFRNLTLEDTGMRFSKVGNGCYSTPYQRRNASPQNSSPYSPQSRGRSGRDNNARAATGASFRNSRTWTSPDAKTQQDFLVVRNAMRRQFKNSDVAKWKLADYIAHREAMLASQANNLARKAEMKEKGLTSSFSEISWETQERLRRWGINGNFEEHGNLGRIFNQPTIWCTNWQDGKDEIAPWPTLAELKWEGDDRAKTGVGRFFPLPREQGPLSIPWNQLAVVEQYPMDQIAKVPTMEDVYLPIDDQIEPDMEYLWNTKLEQDMDIMMNA